jgi:hypothetical protein
MIAANPLPLLKYWPIYLALASGIASWHVKGRFDEAAQARAMQQQVEANQQAQSEIAERAKSAESALASERQLTSYLNKQWSAARAKKSHPDCSLSDDALRVLKDATSPVRNVPR